MAFQTPSRVYPDLSTLNPPSSQSSPTRPAFPSNESTVRNFSSSHQQPAIQTVSAYTKPLQSIAQSEPLQNLTAITQTVLQAQPLTTLVKSEQSPVLTPIETEQFRQTNAKVAFKNLRYNLLYLFALWWTATSKPYLYVQKQVVISKSAVDIGSRWTINLFYLLFCFNVLYSTFQLFRPATIGSPPVALQKPRASQLASHAAASFSPLARSSPKTRPSFPAPAAQSISNSPQRLAQVTANQSTNQTPAKASPQTKERANSGGPFRPSTPTSHVRTAANVQNRDDSSYLREAQVIARQSPKSIIPDRARRASDKFAIEQMLKSLNGSLQQPQQAGVQI